MKKGLLFFAILFLIACSDDDINNIGNDTASFDYRNHAMGNFNIEISRSYTFFNPNINSHTPVNELNLRVYRSTTYDDELIIDGIRGECVYATMTGTEFSFSFVETNFRPEDFGYRITPPCSTCRIYMSGSGSVSENVRGLEESIFRINISFNYDGFELVRYIGSKPLALPRPLSVASDC